MTSSLSHWVDWFWHFIYFFCTFVLNQFVSMIPTRFSTGHAPIHVRKTPFGSLCTLDYQLYANYSYELTVSQAILLSSPLLPFSVISNDSKFSGQRKSNKYYHSTQALHSSYSLPIDQRIQFKIGLIVHRALYLNQP